MDDFISRKVKILNKIDGYGRTLDEEHYMAFYSDFRGKSIDECKKLLRENYIPTETKRVIKYYLSLIDQ